MLQLPYTQVYIYISVHSVYTDIIVHVILHYVSIYIWFIVNLYCFVSND